MIDAKKNGLDMFEYNGKVYVGEPHAKMGTIYKKQNKVM